MTASHKSHDMTSKHVILLKKMTEAVIQAVKLHELNEMSLL